MVIPADRDYPERRARRPAPTFEFSFNDGFAPPQGGNIRLYATWEGVVTSGNSTFFWTKFTFFGKSPHAQRSRSLPA
jgi:hypothetical protein